MCIHKIMLDLMYDFVIPCNFQDIRSGYLFPRIRKKFTRMIEVKSTMDKVLQTWTTGHFSLNMG